jgi:hypothetical protein
MTRFFFRPRVAQLLAVLIFALPLAGGLLSQSGHTGENRFLASFPARPANWQEGLQYPGNIERWINDHMGLRNQLIAANNGLRHALFGQFPTIQVIEGRHGRIFLAAHNTAAPPYSAVFDPCGVHYRRQGQLLSDLNHFAETLEQHGITANLVVAPSAPVMHSADLPRWLARRCLAWPNPLEQVMQHPGLSPRARSHMLYPLNELRQRAQPVFPESWFHWGGTGTRAAADLIEQHFWPAGQQALPPALVSAPRWQASDIAWLFPGVTLGSMVETIDFAASGIEPCEGPDCFPELPDVMAVLRGVSRYRNPHATQPRLMLISDSFGLPLAPWYARYYREVIQVSTNELVRLSKEQQARLRQLFFAGAASQHTLFVYHDGTALVGRITLDLSILLPPDQVSADH